MEGTKTVPKNEMAIIIGKADWDTLLPQLLAYTRWKLKELTWRGSKSGTIPGSKEPMDFIQEAIMKALHGQRLWVQERVDLLTFLKGIISSDINNLVEKSENKLEIRATLAEEETNAFTVDISGLESDPVSPFYGSPYIHYEQKETRDRILSKLQEDKIAYAVVRLVIDEGIDRPKQIAERLNIDIKDVFNAKKRLRRLRQDIIEE